MIFQNDLWVLCNILLLQVWDAEVGCGMSESKVVGMKKDIDLWSCRDRWELILRRQCFSLISLMSGQIFHRATVCTLVLFSWASPVQAFASRKSPLRTAILFPNSMSFSGPSESVHPFRSTIPRCTRNAVWINSVISAKFRWLRNKNKKITLKNHSLFFVNSF